MPAPAWPAPTATCPQAGRWAQGQRPPRAQPPAQHQSRLPDLPQVASEAELKARAETNQDRTFQMRNIAMDALLEANQRHQRSQGRGRIQRRPCGAAQKPCNATRNSDWISSRRRTRWASMPPRKPRAFWGMSIEDSRKGQVALRYAAPGDAGRGQAVGLVAAPGISRLILGGEGEIRTHDTGFPPYNGLGNHHLRPPSHVSVGARGLLR